MDIIIYGAGRNCKPVIDLAKEYEDLNILAIADQDRNKVGNAYYGYKVVSPSDIFKYDATIIVSVVGKADEIKNELTNIGINAGNIIYFSDFFPLKPHNIGTMKIDWEKEIHRDELYKELCSHVDELTPIEKEFLVGNHNRSFKWLHYFEIYNRHFEKFYGKNINIMEVGVNRGGSLQIWKQMFGESANIYGVDITENCKQFEDDQIKIYIGDQADRNFWRKIREEIPKLDILIDDGGHYMDQQIVTFEEMFDHVKEDGVYMCEDTGSSYNPKKYHSGYKKDGTFIEYSKNFVDYIHAWFSNEYNFEVNKYSRNMHSVHFYPGVVAVEKKTMYSPFDMEICNNDKEHYAIPHIKL